MRIFGEVFGKFEEFWRNWFLVRTSDLHLVSASRKFSQQTKKFDYGLQTASEVRFDLRFGICGPNCICNHVCFGCLGLFLDKSQNKIKKEQTHNYYTCATQVKKGTNACECERKVRSFTTNCGKLRRPCLAS